MINVYIMVQMLGNLTEEDLFSEFADLLKKAVTWTLRTIVACIVGVNVVQGLLAPAIDTVKKKCAYKDGRGTSVDRKCDGRNGGSDNGNDCFD